jgi:antitoxin MazE
MRTESSFVTVQARGVIAIPSAIRRRFGLDRPGAQVEVVERDGEIVLRPHIPVPSDQAWFWTERWQKMEREADDDIAARHVASFENVDDFLSDLDS